MNELKQILTCIIEIQTSRSIFFSQNLGICSIVIIMRLDGRLNDNTYKRCDDLIRGYLDDEYLDVICGGYPLSIEEEKSCCHTEDDSHLSNIAIYDSIEDKWDLRHAQGKLRQRICIEMLEMLEELES